MDASELIAALRPVVSDTLIATDFDGTLAPLATDPQDSRPVAGAVQTLRSLAERGARVAVITGRDARTALRLGGLDHVPGITVAGLYGLETWTDGQLSTMDEPESIARLRERLPAVVTAGDPDVWIEDKRLSLVVHARRAADPDAALAQLRAAVEALGAELGLEVHPGADVLELRLPGYDKAGVLTRLVGDLRSVLFLGDDVGDLPAFEEIRRMRAAGVTAYGVGVLSSGVSGIESAADVHVPDPDAAADLLAQLLG